MAISMIITTQGLQSLSTGGATEISELALGRGIYTAGPNQTALQQPIKRLPASGTSTNGVIHVSANDTSDTSYQCYELGLYDTQDTLIAVYSQSEPLLIKADVSTALITVAIAFNSHLADHITFANTNFTYPAATTELAGVSRLATLNDANNQTAGAVIDGQILTSYVDQTINQKSSSATDQNNDQQLATSAAIYQLKTLIEANAQDIQSIKSEIDSNPQPTTIITGSYDGSGAAVNLEFEEYGQEDYRIRAILNKSDGPFNIKLYEVHYDQGMDEMDIDQIPTTPYNLVISQLPLQHSPDIQQHNDEFNFLIFDQSEDKDDFNTPFSFSITRTN